MDVKYFNKSQQVIEFINLQENLEHNFFLDKNCLNKYFLDVAHNDNVSIPTSVLLEQLNADKKITSPFFKRTNKFFLFGNNISNNPSYSSYEELNKLLVNSYFNNIRKLLTTELPINNLPKNCRTIYDIYHRMFISKEKNSHLQEYIITEFEHIFSEDKWYLKNGKKKVRQPYVNINNLFDTLLLITVIFPFDNTKCNKFIVSHNHKDFDNMAVKDICKDININFIMIKNEYN